jgi:agmatinase
MLTSLPQIYFMADHSNFDPNSVGLRSNNIFGLPFSQDEASLILIPVPWEVTVSYRSGTAEGPATIYEAAMQVDLYDPDMPNAWRKGFFMQTADEQIRAKSDKFRQYAEAQIAFMANGGTVDENEEIKAKLNEINDACIWLRDTLYQRCLDLLKQGKKVGLIGGDHSTPLGFIKALAQQNESFGVLQVDAHCDLREAYEGFTYSHASIMYNVLKEIPQVKSLVQVGIRDYCDDELALITRNPDRIVTYFDKEIKERQYEGESWRHIAEEIIDNLPAKVYISFDIDGLDPKLCPNTGTPVPGGFEMEQVFYLFKLLKQSGREIIGFDLNEVACGENAADSIDAIAGARVLYKLCNYLATA